MQASAMSEHAVMFNRGALLRHGIPCICTRSRSRYTLEAAASLADFASTLALSASILSAAEAPCIAVESRELSHLATRTSSASCSSCLLVAVAWCRPF